MDMTTKVDVSGTDTSTLTNAELSVIALLNDLRFVVGRLQPEEWPHNAQAVLDHHEPPIADVELPAGYQGLQSACRATLMALLADDYAQAKSSIADIRRFEGWLGLG